tara:strand:- start:395 stop:835 length:441 start_codon:yes stop_codon:yes gene_type:complete
MIDLITNDLKNAMKSKNKAKIIGLRNLLGRLKAEQINKGSDLNKQESMKILNRTAKQIKDSIKQYANAEREDLVEIESYELSLVENYLPKPMDEETMRLEIKKIIVDNNATSISEMGKIMGICMSRLSGNIDGNIVQKIVREELQA